MRSFRFFRASLLPAVLVFALGTTGCDDDNPAAPSATPHEDFEGVLIQTSDGTELIRQFEGTITGSLAVEAGSTLAGLQIWFLDENGDPARPEDDHDHDHGAEEHAEEEHAEEEVYSLAFSIDDAAVVQIVKTTGEEWAVDLTGVQAGATEVQFMVMHGDHADFTSLALPVSVTAPVVQ